MIEKKKSTVYDWMVCAHVKKDYTASEDQSEFRKGKGYAK